MKYAIGVVPGGDVDIHALVELAHQADEIGWDGSCMFKETHGKGWLDMQPEDIRALKAFV